ncbi:thermonuclease family protein [Prosthecomicrobium sp. N25]|uniref:thermonuclease family protein n=1 Tax=Prosthecomicrobium sp. N25 TaxID=3129254 RepID=UPI0030785320
MRAWIGYALTASVTGLAMAGAVWWRYADDIPETTLAASPAAQSAPPAAVPVPPTPAPPRAAPAEGGPKAQRRFPQSAFSPGEIIAPAPSVTAKTLAVGADGVVMPPAGAFAPVTDARDADPQPTASVRTAALTPPAEPIRSVPARAEEIRLNLPSVADARTLTGDGRRIRLSGLALPPEGKACRKLDGTAEPCRDRARTQLELFLRHRPVVCAVPAGSKAAADGRCRIGEADVAEWLVRSGWALAEVDAPEKLRKAAAEAQRQRLGMWR